MKTKKWIIRFCIIVIIIFLIFFACVGQNVLEHKMNGLYNILLSTFASIIVVLFVTIIEYINAVQSIV